MALTKLQSAGEFVEASVKILADDFTILRQGAEWELSAAEQEALLRAGKRSVRLITGLLEMAREMKK